jgi:signal transduction histidine kinase
VETLRALGELAGGAAHHLNNLLTIVVGRIQLMRRSVREEKLARPLEIIERAAKDGAEVVRRLQQFAGMRRAVEPRTVDLTPFRASRFAEGKPWIDEDHYGRERLTISR